jgi:hypothetical protein
MFKEKFLVCVRIPVWPVVKTSGGMVGSQVKIVTNTRMVYFGLAWFHAMLWGYLICVNQIQTFCVDSVEFEGFRISSSGGT